MFTCPLGRVPARPTCREQPGSSLLSAFAFGNKLVYMFLSSAGTRAAGSCPCPAVGPMFLPSWARGPFVLVPNGEQVTSAKKERAAEPWLSLQSWC